MAASAAPAAASSRSEQLPYPLSPNQAMMSSMYPGLADYMGLEFTENIIRENMPEYLPIPLQQVSLHHHHKKI